MNMTKLDVLSGLDEIKVGLRYRAKDGTILTSVPADLNVLEGVTVSSRAVGPSEWEAGRVDCGNLGQGHWQRHTAEVLNAWRAPPMWRCARFTSATCSTLRVQDVMMLRLQKPLPKTF